MSFNFAEKLNELQKVGLGRELQIYTGIDFSSNDYLGLAAHPLIKKQLIQFAKESHELGATGSRHISGNYALIEKVEVEIAEYFKCESALLFGSGYLANVGVLSALGGAEVEFFSDELNHASIIDGIKLARSSCRIFRHNDLEHLQELLRKSCAQNKVIVTESIFSMDGDEAPLEGLADLAQKYAALLVVDEAHATGVLGHMGCGLSHSLKLAADQLISIHTCGKALGAYGAFVCSSKIGARWLVNKARTHIFSTALPPLVVAHIGFSFNLLKEQGLVLRNNLGRNTAYLHQLLKKAAVPTALSKSHIIPVLISGNASVMRVAECLQMSGFKVKAIRSPTVAAGSERLRLTCKEFHTVEQMNSLTQKLAELIYG